MDLVRGRLMGDGEERRSLTWKAAEDGSGGAVSGVAAAARPADPQKPQMKRMDGCRWGTMS